ncbi:NUDIX domain-containing protein [Clostridium sp. D2Q-11]|uniref:NUDIX domain-containing protein n=1 Tax=Anaeromonas frigoriresistens TaxID=2683708 RepID=A0A942UR96_9FIRM|nr:NUDIX domain-containing protein [Anaeromonas frigoriresistens]MBS4537809.1 NUDIX domain-containing protein [Anaeromonas frigoriresistens]
MEKAYYKSVKDNKEMEIVITEILNIDEEYRGAIVIPFYGDKFVMTYHPGRKGWEFPGGKQEENENLLQCAIRETFEETGAILSKLNPIGYYRIIKGENSFKTLVYIGEIAIFEPKPRWSETDLVKLFDELPENISFDDDIYKIIIDHIKTKG